MGCGSGTDGGTGGAAGGTDGTGGVPVRREDAEAIAAVLAREGGRRAREAEARGRAAASERDAAGRRGCRRSWREASDAVLDAVSDGVSALLEMHEGAWAFAGAAMGRRGGWVGAAEALAAAEVVRGHAARGGAEARRSAYALAAAEALERAALSGFPAVDVAAAAARGAAGMRG